jgi:hypothetical protein
MKIETCFAGPFIKFLSSIVLIKRTEPSAGETITLSSAGIFLSGSLKKFKERRTKIRAVTIIKLLRNELFKNKLPAMIINAVIQMIPRVEYPYFVNILSA